MTLVYFRILGSRGEMAHSLVGGGAEGGRITVIINHLMFNRVIFVVPRKFSTGQRKKEQEQAPHRRSWESTGV